MFASGMKGALTIAKLLSDFSLWPEMLVYPWCLYQVLDLASALMTSFISIRFRKLAQAGPGAFPFLAHCS